MDEIERLESRWALIQAALDHVDQGFTVFDANLELIGWNARFFNLLEFPAELARIGTPFADFIRVNAERGEYGEGDTEEQVRTRVDLAKTFVPHEFERRRPTGEIIAVSGAPLPGGGFVTTYTDVTAERSRQFALESAVRERTQALGDSEAKLRLITDAVPALIAYLDSDWVYRFANRRYAEWYGHSVDGMLGLKLSDVLEPRLYDQIAPNVAASLAGEARSYEYRRVGPDGTLREMRSTLIPDLGGDDIARGCFVLSLDVTEQNNREAALRQAQKMEAVGQLTGGIAHDFNNLLTIILGNLRGLRDTSGERAPAAEPLESAIYAAERGAELTRQLLSFARERPLEARRIDVEAVISDLSRMLRRSLPSSIEVVTHARGLPSPALIDPGQLENALLNLALNARDAIDGAGRIVFGVSQLEVTEEDAQRRRFAPGAPAPGEYVCIEVSDDGRGIAADALPRVFEPFFTTKDFGVGGGLGLSMVYAFVRQSQGAVEIVSAPGAGTRVTLLLPAAEGRAASADGAAPPGAAKAPSGAPAPRRDLVLLVEDDSEVRKVVRQQLTGLGRHVLEAQNAEDALELLEQVHEIQFLLSDIVMPGSYDGIALAEMAAQRAPRVGVVLMTGYAAQTELADQARIPILNKPFSTEELLKAFARAKVNAEADLDAARAKTAIAE